MGLHSWTFCGGSKRPWKECNLTKAIRTDNGIPFVSPNSLFNLFKLSVWSLRPGINDRRTPQRLPGDGDAQLPPSGRALLYRHSAAAAGVKNLFLSSAAFALVLPSAWKL